MSWRVAVSPGVHTACRAALEARGCEVLLQGGLARADALVLAADEPVTQDLLAGAPRARVVARAGPSLEGVDVAAVTRHGALLFTSSGGSAATAEAETALALITGAARRLPAAAASLRGGEWARERFVGAELRGKTLGVVGLGRAGAAVAGWAHALGMAGVVGFDPRAEAPASARAAGVELVPRLADLWPRADVLALHTPLTPVTRGMVDAEALAACRPGVVLVNCGPADVLDAAAVRAALEDGRVGGVGLAGGAAVPEELAGHPLVSSMSWDGPDGGSGGGGGAAEAHEAALHVSEALETGSGAAVNAPHMGIAQGAAEQLRPFVALASALGRLVAQTHPGAPARVELRTAGGRDVDVAAADARALLEAAALAGLLGDGANLVSAPSRAKEAGVFSGSGSASASAVGDDSLHNVVALEVELRSGETTTVVGTVFGSQPFVVQIDDYAGFHSFPPEGVMLGVTLARPSSTLGVLAELEAAGINVARMSMGSRADGCKLAVLLLDSPVPEEVVGALGGMEGVRNVRVASL